MNGISTTESEKKSLRAGFVQAKSAAELMFMGLGPSLAPVDHIGRLVEQRATAKSEVGDVTIERINRQVAIVTSKVITDEVESPGENIPMELPVDDESLFAVNDTILFPELRNIAGKCVTGVVTEISAGKISGFYTCTDDSGIVNVPDIPEGAEIVLMGRTARELDMQTSLYRPDTESHASPKNYTQQYKAQIEVGGRLGWANGPEPEMEIAEATSREALLDMRLRMERSLLFGNRLYLETGGDNGGIYMSAGLWDQAGTEVTYTAGAMTGADFYNIVAKGFSMNGVGHRLIIVGGSGFAGQVNALGLVMNNVIDLEGLKMSECMTVFGPVCVVCSMTFDDCGRENNALLIEPDDMVKFIRQPFDVVNLDMSATGKRNSTGRVWSEEMCLLLKHPERHIRVEGR